jgi:hypothetical protein
MKHPEKDFKPSGSSRRSIRGWRRSAGRAARAVAVLLMITLIWHPAMNASKAAEFSEYQVKAAFLLNFTRYVDWPKGSFAKPDSPLVICVLGQDRFGDDLRTLIADKSVEGRKIVLRKADTIDQCRDCHILFISQSEKSRFAAILQKLKGLPILTVADSEGFIAAGGMINFKTKAERVRLEINRTAAENVGLKISSKLLQIADVTEETKPEPKIE